MQFCTSLLLAEIPWYFSLVACIPATNTNVVVKTVNNDRVLFFHFRFRCCASGVTREKSARFLLYKPVMTAGMTMPCRNFAWLPMRLLQIHPVARLEPRPVVTSSPSQVPAQTAPAQAVQTQMVPNCKPFWQNVSRNNCTLWTVFMGYIQHCAL